jgi:hypothetical protein
MFQNKKCLKDAFVIVQKKRNIIRPNDGFIQQLMEYEIKLFEKQLTYQKDLTLGTWGPTKNKINSKNDDMIDKNNKINKDNKKKNKKN